MPRLQDRLSNFSSNVIELNSQKNSAEVNDQNLKNNNTFFKSLDQNVYPLIDFLTISRNFNDAAFRLSSETEFEIVTLLKSCQLELQRSVAIHAYEIANKASKLAAKVTSEWNALVIEKTRELSDNLAILKFVVAPEQAGQIAKILLAIGKFSNFPISEATAADFSQKIIDGNEFLKGEKFSLEVKCFLQKVKDKTATILDLTPSIMTWIKENHFENRIFVTISQASVEP